MIVTKFCNYSYQIVTCSVIVNSFKTSKIVKTIIPISNLRC